MADLPPGLQLALDHAVTLDSVFQQINQLSDDDLWAAIQARWPAAKREDFFRDPVSSDDGGSIRPPA